MISILTPAFNEERHLEGMLKSVCAQSCPDWELLLVDDGSQDRTAKIIEEWAAKDQRIKIVSLGVKLGKVPAFNLLFSEASGDLICHVGADDLLPEDSLDVRRQELAESSGSAVLLGKFQMIDSDGEMCSGIMPRGANGSQSSPGATYNRELADIIFPIPEELPSEDIWLGNAAVGCANQIIHTGNVIIHYRVHGGNSNPRAKTFEKMSDAINARMEALRLLSDSDLPIREQYRDDLSNRYQLESLRRSGDLRKVLTHRPSKLVDRVAIASMASPTLWRMRQHLGVLATGWRGR